MMQHTHLQNAGTMGLLLLVFPIRQTLTLHLTKGNLIFGLLKLTLKEIYYGKNPSEALPPNTVMVFYKHAITVFFLQEKLILLMGM